MSTFVVRASGWLGASYKEGTFNDFVTFDLDVVREDGKWLGCR